MHRPCAIGHLWASSCWSCSTRTSWARWHAGSASGRDGIGSAREVAEWSSAIVGEAPALRPVAAIVGQSPRPYRRPGEERDPGLPASAQVVKVAVAYDGALGRGEEGVEARDALGVQAGQHRDALQRRRQG